MRPRHILLAALLSIVLLSTGCTRDLHWLDAPAVGDVYAAELGAFSAFGFTDDDGADIDPAHGLMRVVAVDADGVTVVTANRAQATPARARRQLRDAPAAIEFDDSERIRIALADLRRARDAGTIYAARRPMAE